MKKITFVSCALIFCILLSLIVTANGNAAEPLSVSAKSAVLVLGDSGEIVWSKNSRERLPMASTTKIMTAIVAIENCSDLSKTVKIDSSSCGIEGSSIYLKEGEKLTVEQLLFALLLESANDCACAISVEIAGSIEKFAELMNNTAAKIGMTDSHFTNPHGLDDEEHYTTAEDMAKLAVYALKNETFAKIVSTYKTTIPMNGDEGTRLLLNHNKMLKYYDGAVGVKTGFTKRSGRCLVSAAMRDGVKMIAVTLSAPDDWNDHKNMLDYGFANYKHIVIADPGKISITLPVTGGNKNTITVSNRDTAELTVPIGDDSIRCRIEAPRFVYAPICEGEAVGYACFYKGDTQIAKLPLYTDTECTYKEKPPLWHRILEMYK